MRDILEKKFRFKYNRTTLRTEIVAGFTSYFTVLYLVFLVPNTIMQAFPHVYSNGEIVMDALAMPGVTASQMLTALTVSACLAAGLASVIMGLVVNIPFSQGPSLSCTTFITYTVCVNLGYTYFQALAMVFTSGLLFLILNLIGLEEKIQDAIPNNIKYAVTAGIGLFIAFIGLQKSYIIEPSESPNLILTLFKISAIGSEHTKTALLTIAGVLFITVLLKKNVHGAILIGKLTLVFAAIPLGLFSMRNFMNFEYSLSIEPVFFKMDFMGIIFNSTSVVRFPIISAVLIVVSICIIDVFETLGTLIATDIFLRVNNHKEDNVNEKLHKIFDVDAITTYIGALFGATNISTYIENSAAIVEGGRTGLTAVITGIMFFLTVFIAPIAPMIPVAATASTLIVTGVLMMSTIKYVDFEDPLEAVPAFLTIIIMPLTYSLVTGVAFGLISYPLLSFFTGDSKKIKPLTYVLAMIFLLILIMVY